jgi:hypothetical protein
MKSRPYRSLDLLDAPDSVWSAGYATPIIHQRDDISPPFAAEYFLRFF